MMSVVLSLLVMEDEVNAVKIDQDRCKVFFRHNCDRSRTICIDTIHMIIISIVQHMVPLLFLG